MGNEYVFFDEGLCERFLTFARERGLAADRQRDEMEAWVAILPEDLDESLEDEIEACYEDLMVVQRDLVEAAPEEDVHRVMGVNVMLPDGACQVVRVPGPYALRLMEHFTLDEIREMVTAIAAEVTAPRNRPLCKP